MSRVYYREPKIIGESLEIPNISVSDFKKMMSFRQEIPIEIPSISPLKFWKNKGKRFKYAIIWNEEKEYANPNLGSYFTPQSITFFDEQDFYFPSDFYFIVMINNQLEVRQCHAGEGVKWTEIADMHTPVTTTELIKRVESSFDGLKELYFEK